MSNSSVFPSAESSAKYVIDSGAAVGLDNWLELLALAKPKKAPLPFKVIVPAVSSYVQVKEPELSCGETGDPHASGSVPCHGSNQVVEPSTFSNEPSAPNTYSSSNKHARVVTSAVEFDHHETSFLFGPTPNAAASGANFHVPARGTSEGSGALTT